MDDSPDGEICSEGEVSFGGRPQQKVCVLVQVVFQHILHG